MLRIRGTAQRNDGAIEESIATLSAGRDLANRHGGLDLADEITLSLSGAEAMAGHLETAEELMSEVADRRSDTIGDKACAQLGALYTFTSRSAAGAETLAGLSARLEAAGEFEWAARAASNRGWCLIQIGQAAEAIGELQRGIQLWTRLGAIESASQPGQHLAFAYSLLGRPADALQTLTALWQDRSPTFDDLLDAAELYEQTGLVDDALEHVRRARAAAVGSRQTALAQIAEARLYVSIGRFDQAMRAAADAGRSFTDLGATDMAFEAAVLRVAAQTGSGHPSPSDVAVLTPPAGAESSRSTSVARALSAEIRLADGDIGFAEAEVAEMLTAQDRVGIAFDMQLKTLAARTTSARGRPQQAIEESLATLRQLGEQAAAMGIADLTVAARGHGSQLGDFALDLAIGRRDLDSVVEITDRLRALDAQPRAEPSPEVMARLSHYRQLRSHDADAGALDKAEVELREAIRTTVGAGASSVPSPSISELQGALDGAQLLLFVEHSGKLSLVHVTKDDAGIYERGEVATAEDLAAKVRMRFVSALGGGDAAPGFEALRGQVDRLAGALFDDLGLAEGPIVLIPPPGIFGVPWNLIGPLAGRRLVINASPAGWLAASRLARVDRAGTTAYVAGPAPAQAAVEVKDLHAADPSGKMLSGRAATVDAVIAAIDQSDRVHVATHGVARTDNPIFSSLDLADGPLTLYEMQTVAAPSELIISACAIGRPRTYRGGLAVGLPAVALAAGTRVVIAAEVDVPDEPTRRAMLALHGLLRSGMSPSDALAATVAQLVESDPQAAMTALAFNAYGA